MTVRVAAVARLGLAGLALLPVTACTGEPTPPRTATVAIVDTGIAPGPWLEGQLDETASLSVVGGGLADDDGHGTAMASVVHAAAPDARLLAVKAVGSDGTSDERLAEGIDRAVAAGASVVLLSMAGAEPLPRTRSAIRRAARHDAIVVAAAGNDGLDLGRHPAYPAAYDEPNLVAVAAVARDGTLLGTSNRGPTVTAKGLGVGVPACDVDGHATTTGATSAAAALVAAEAARRLALPVSIADLRAALTASPATRGTPAPCP